MEKILNKLKTPCPTSNPTLYEKQVWQKQAYLCGIDEVGRGCLAGPVVTAAVVLFPSSTHPLLKDSKILTENKRLEAASWIGKNSWFSYGIVDAREIDRLNIYKATQVAMRQAVYGLFSRLPKHVRPELILIDAMPLQAPFLDSQPEIISFPFGESRSISIAAASILAKVKRDELISRMTRSFPAYSFQTHKGYGTAAHHKELRAHGPSLLHRATFLKHVSNQERSQDEECPDRQASLFC